MRYTFKGPKLVNGKWIWPNMYERNDAIEQLTKAVTSVKRDPLLIAILSKMRPAPIIIGGTLLREDVDMEMGLVLLDRLTELGIDFDPCERCEMSKGELVDVVWRALRSLSWVTVRPQ